MHDPEINNPNATNVFEIINHDGYHIDVTNGFTYLANFYFRLH
jgi:hypothetical protein